MKMLFIIPLFSLESPPEGGILIWITEMHQEWSEILEKIKQKTGRIGMIEMKVLL